MTGHAARKHSKFPASASERWINCPGSVKLSETAPAPIDTEAAREGTLGHECLEFIVPRFKNPSVEKLAKEKWSQEMIRHGLTAAGVIYDLRPSPSAKLLVETRVALPHIDEKMWGTLDYAWVEDWGHLVVIDYKYGKGHAVMPVDYAGRENTQLMYYAAGLLQKFGDEFEKISLVIVQPRTGDGGAFVCETTVDRIREFEQTVRKAIKLALSPKPPLKAGEHCRYCPANVICPEISKNTMAGAGIVFDFEDGVQALPEVRGMDAATIGRMLTAADTLEIWIGAIRKYAFGTASNGAEIEGYKMVPTRSIRHWNDGIEEKLEKAFGKSVYEVKKVFPSPAQLEKLKGPAGKAFADKHATKVSSGHTLVPDSDSRPGTELGSVFDYDPVL